MYFEFMILEYSCLIRCFDTEYAIKKKDAKMATFWKHRVLFCVQFSKAWQPFFNVRTIIAEYPAVWPFRETYTKCDLLLRVLICSHHFLTLFPRCM